VSSMAAPVESAAARSPTTEGRRATNAGAGRFPHALSQVARLSVRNAPQGHGGGGIEEIASPVEVGEMASRTSRPRLEAEATLVETSREGEVDVFARRHD